MRFGNMEKMVMGIVPSFKVSDFLAIVNQTFDMAFGAVEVEGEVASFSVNHQKYVFFDLKDDEGSVNCFMTVWQLRVPVEDGMRVIVRAVPKVTKWGKFSLTVTEVRPVGEGSLKKSFELLKEKLGKEGLFDDARKRSLPKFVSRVAIISSTSAAGYADFMKIAASRYGGVGFVVANVLVQGPNSPKQIIRAIEYFNQLSELPEVIVIVRGGGSADDLSAFNDEPLVRAIAASRIPVLTGIGHDTDETLSDLVADVAAVTPTNAAQLLLPDRDVLIATMEQQLESLRAVIGSELRQIESYIGLTLRHGIESAHERIDRARESLAGTEEVLRVLDPYAVLARGYALIRGERHVGEVVTIETMQEYMKAEIKEYYER